MIDYKIIDNSIKFYEDNGFNRIESPWTVTKSISAITKPEGKIDWEINGKNKVLVASGEQSFLYLYLKGFLPKGKYQTTTPCFRDEVFDQYHTKYFIKNELIVTDNVNQEELHKMIKICKKFFEKELKEDVEVRETEIGYDIEVRGIEIGSYGIRGCEYLDWIYGTGVAEPRLSMIKNIIKNESKRSS